MTTILTQGEGAHLRSASVIKNIKLQTTSRASGTISLNIAQIDTQSLIDLLRGLQ
ncbi:hypothetical protein [Psychrobacter sanguinis]|uniref:hypothetical protein n=1 Tax=Psychrobacter sanguinis TaxID=861445 RepID=UPI001D1572D1|nr:hypothetical protein [Psychrobacter sanguinis]UEC26079.1 hypothetical protein LK453_02775 [Psychrobacter sanguinis]